MAVGHRMIYPGREAQLRAAKGAVAPLTHVRGLWYLQVRINKGRAFLLVDSGAACHVCAPAWVQRMSPREQAASVVDQDNRPWRACAIAEDVRASPPLPSPVKQDASLAKDRQTDTAPRKAGHTSRISTTTKNALRFWRINAHRATTARCSAVLAGVARIPWYH